MLAHPRCSLHSIVAHARLTLLHSDQVKISTIEHSCACSAFCAALGHASIALSIARCISVSAGDVHRTRCTSPVHVPVSYRIIPSIGQATSQLGGFLPYPQGIAAHVMVKALPLLTGPCLTPLANHPYVFPQVSVYRLPRDAEHLCKRVSTSARWLRQRPAQLCRLLCRQ